MQRANLRIFWTSINPSLNAFGLLGNASHSLKGWTRNQLSIGGIISYYFLSISPPPFYASTSLETELYSIINTNSFISPFFSFSTDCSWIPTGVIFQVLGHGRFYSILYFIFSCIFFLSLRMLHVCVCPFFTKICHV